MQSDSIGQLAQALSQAQSEIRGAQMNAVNPFLKNKYANLGAVIATVREPFAKNKLAYTQLPFSDGAMVGIETVLMHESGEYLKARIALPMVEERGKSQAQVMGSIITYLRRYSLASVAGVYDDEDTDGNAPPSRASQSERNPESLPVATEPESIKRIPSEATQALKPNDNGKPKDKSTAYYNRARELGITTQTAAQILNAHKNGAGGYDWTKATQEIESLQPA